MGWFKRKKPNEHEKMVEILNNFEEILIKYNKSNKTYLFLNTKVERSCLTCRAAYHFPLSNKLYCTRKPIFNSDECGVQHKDVGKFGFCDKYISNPLRFNINEYKYYDIRNKLVSFIYESCGINCTTCMKINTCRYKSLLTSSLTMKTNDFIKHFLICDTYVPNFNRLSFIGMRKQNLAVITECDFYNSKLQFVIKNQIIYSKDGLINTAPIMNFYTEKVIKACKEEDKFEFVKQDIGRNVNISQLYAEKKIIDGVPCFLPKCTIIDNDNASFFWIFYAMGNSTPVTNIRYVDSATFRYSDEEIDNFIGIAESEEEINLPPGVTRVTWDEWARSYANTRNSFPTHNITSSIEAEWVEETSDTSGYSDNSEEIPRFYTYGYNTTTGERIRYYL